jgi:hypothetical protein
MPFGASNTGDALIKTTIPMTITTTIAITGALSSDLVAGEVVGVLELQVRLGADANVIL